MFTSIPAFCSVYIPLVVLAILAVIFEERLVAFEQRIKRAIFGKKKSRSTVKQMKNSHSEKPRKQIDRSYRHAA